jgi:hypothetical protein
VSDEAIGLIADTGCAWTATDEGILARSLDRMVTAESLYRPYRIGRPDQPLTCLFRDHGLSDLIGFSYQSWSAEAAADDFVKRVRDAGQRFAAEGGEGDAVVSVILDGENAWEHFEGGGRPFLRALYGRLSQHPELQTVTMAEACAGPAQELASIFPGSWIDANFYIWIGHADDQQAWSQLADARDALDAAQDTDAESVARAREEVLIAEGSDWFWWYGDDHSSAHDLEFDDLFRRHLKNVYRLLKRPSPDELFVSNISHGAATTPLTHPSAWLSPTLDGEETSYFEWLGAGQLEVLEMAGAMHQAARRPSTLTRVQFGFDQAHLFVRLDANRPIADLLAEGWEFSLKFLRPDGVRFSLRQAAGRLNGLFWHRRPTPPHWVERGPCGSRVAAENVAELAVPLVDLGVGAGYRLAFFVSAFDINDVELERHPEHRPIELEIPDEQFESRNWSA